MGAERPGPFIFHAASTLDAARSDKVEPLATCEFYLHTEQVGKPLILGGDEQSPP
jgi:hypothetical protein